jgi:intraflagellar transport protein 56
VCVGITKAKKAPAKKPVKGEQSLDEFISKRDYTGALTLLEFKLKCQDGDTKELLQWIGYTAFHLGNYKRVSSQFCLFSAAV